MKSLGLSKQIIIIAILPALLVGLMLSVYFTYNQLSFISASQIKYGNFIIKQIVLAAERTLIINDLETLKPILENTATNEDINYLRISDTSNNDIIVIDKLKDKKENSNSFLQSLFEKKRSLEFKAPVYYSYKLPDGTTFSEVIAKIEVQLSTKQATMDKIEHLIRGGTITFLILILFTFIILKFSRNIIAPIHALTDSVRKITAGDLDSDIKSTSTGEIGVLESCISRMKDELKESRTDLEIQLNVFTDELQQTLEELEIRNAELDITRSKAIYANNAKSEFLANMSHEIRTPLSGIIGFTELLQSTELSSQQKDYATTIQKSSKSLLEIINDILDLSKIESGKTEITTSEFNLINIVEDIINLLSPTALEKDIELFYRIDKNIPVTIHSDPFRIHQILTNLIGNAIKFTDEGYVYLQVTAGEITDAETSIKFSVSDTGIGMNSEDKKKLFKAFTQADTSITRRFGGTGLGLVISRKLTLLMNGEIGFDSTESEGSTFWFSIPVTPVPEQYIKPELADKKVAFISNHFIAKQAFKSLLDSAQCRVSDYAFEDLLNLNKIENDNDVVILFLSRKEINNTETINYIETLNFSRPSLLIASTRSHKKLRLLQHHIFDSAVFTSEKIERIKQKLINTINRNTQETETVHPEDITSNSQNWSDINVMVVDDNEVNLRLAEIILHKHKARVTTARSGAQAIDYACMNTFDIIFMDLHMPGIDGYETTKKIREITPGKQPVIIALTANALSSEKENVINSGMNGILIKPVSESILQKVINQWVMKESIDASELETKTAGSSNNIQPEDQETGNNNAIFSIDIAKEFTGNNEDLAYELFGMLRTELNSYAEAISAASKNNNLTELYEQVHKLHGASRCCGTTELKKTSSRIENLINQKINFDIKKETQSLLNAIKNVAELEI